MRGVVGESNGKMRSTPRPIVASASDPRSEVIDLVVRELAVVIRRATDELAMEIGALVIRRFYGGNLGAWRSRGLRDPTFRQLAAHPDLPISASALYRSVSVYEMRRRFASECWAALLTSTHFAAVVNLPHVEQHRLLSSAHAKDWTTRELERAAVEVRQLHGRTGRRRVAPIVKAIRQLSRDLEHVVQTVTVDRLATGSRQELAHVVHEMEIAIAHVTRALQQPDGAGE